MGFYPNIPELLYLKWHQERLRKAEWDYLARQAAVSEQPLYLKLGAIFRASRERCCSRLFQGKEVGYQISSGWSIK
jgi:hypothetical protein